MREFEVVIEGSFKLSATLSLPVAERQKYPLIVMVHGSGDLDRDENAKRLRINAFKELSDVAVESGYATLRYDKRGVGKSEGDFFSAGLHDLIDDAVEVIRFGKKQLQIDSDRVIILGHSEGAIIAPAINQKESVAGMILLAGTAEPLAETTVWQREEMKKDMRMAKGFEGWILRLLKMDRKIDKMNERLKKKIEHTDKDVIRYQGRKMSAKWDREHRGYNVREFLPKVTCPVLAITGTKDVQVKPEQVYEIVELVKGRAEAHLMKDVTHLLRKTDKPLSFSAILKDYKNQAKQPIDQEVKDVVARWLDKQKRS